jgi:hypothetical protein
MERLNAEEFMVQVLDEIEDLSSDLRRRLVEIASISPAARVSELEKAFREEAGG